MTDLENLVETLRSTSAVLMELRKAIAAGKHIEAMAEIDTLPSCRAVGNQPPVSQGISLKRAKHEPTIRV